MAQPRNKTASASWERPAIDKRVAPVTPEISSESQTHAATPDRKAHAGIDLANIELLFIERGP
jgi:hypothetical protein